MLIKIPKSSGKTDLKELTDVPRFEYSGSVDREKEKALYSFSVDGFSYDWLLVQKPAPVERLFVLLSGAAVGEHLAPPVFQRWRWAEHFPGHCMYISDPTIRLEKEFKLAWYAGTHDHEPLAIIAELIEKIADQLKIDSKNVYAYGSSGGGFAALQLAKFLPDLGVVAVNPQTDITKYEQRSVEKFLRICFGGLSRDQALAQYPERMSVVNICNKLNSHRIIYVQNVLDTHHVGLHLTPFKAKILSMNPESENIRWIEFSHPGGHGVAESPEVFTEIMKIIVSS